MSNEGDGQTEDTKEDLAEEGGESEPESIEDVNEDDRDTPVEETVMADLKQRARRLDEREMGLDARAEKLDEREDSLDERETELSERREQLADEYASLEDRQEQIERREGELDEREAAIEEREQELEAYATKLDERDETLREYVDDQVGESVEESMSSILEEHTAAQSGRFGPTGGFLLGLVGLVLVVGGVGNALATEAATLPTLLSSTTVNVVVSAVLILVGLAVNLAAATDRI
jgi:ribonuclease Y